MTLAVQKKTSYINTRVTPSLKAEADHVLDQLGVSTTEAINMFLKQIVMHQGLPFSVRIPNAETIAALQDAENYPETLKSYNGVDAMMNDIWPTATK